MVRSDRWERRRDRLEAQGIAVAVYLDILKLPTAIDNARDALDRIVAANVGVVGQSVAASVQIAGSIEVPPMLERNADRLHVLGDAAGPACIQLGSLIWQQNEVADSVGPALVSANAKQWPEGVARIKDHLDLLAAVVEKCEHEVKPIHESVKG